MAKGRTYQSNFTMGQVSAALFGRVDLGVYVAAVAGMANFLPAATGPARRRPGFLDEGAPKYNDRRARLAPFQRSVADRLTLEFGDDYLRFWNPDGSPVLAAGVPYEIISPYGVDQLAGLDAAQSNDVVYLVAADGLVAPQALQRRGPTDWAFVEPERVNGPWRETNTYPGGGPNIATDKSLKGGVTAVTAGFDLFVPQHVGSRFRLLETYGGAKAWTPDRQMIVDWEMCVSDGKWYRTAGTYAGEKTGNSPPIHDIGILSDGHIPWEFLHDGSGILEITAVADPQHATGLIISMMPTAGVGTGSGATFGMKLAPGDDPPFTETPYWAEEAWSDYRGWPKRISPTDEERLAFANNASEPGRIWLTRTAGFTPQTLDFHPGLGSGRVVDDDAVRRNVSAGGDPIVWLEIADYLMLGTDGAEYAFAGPTLDDPISPAGARARRLSRVGSREVNATPAGDALLFVPRGGRGLQVIRLAPDQGFAADDLALFAEDLVEGRVAELAWAPHPNNTLWARTDAGELLSVIYHPKQTVFGWQRHPLPGGFTVESFAVVHDPDGEDVLRMVVVRQKAGAPQRRIWRQARRWRPGRPVSEMLYLDGAEIYEGAPAQLLAGLDHLAGEAVRCLALTETGEVVVTGGVVGAATGTFDVGEPVVWAIVGLNYESRIDSLPLDIQQAPAGTSAGALQRVTDVNLYLTDFVSAEARFGDGPWEFVGGQAWAGETIPETRWEPAKVGNVTSRQAVYSVRHDDVWPLTVLALGAKGEAND